MEWLEAFNLLRKQSGMTLDDISEKSGISKSTISKITSGVSKNPSIETMKILVHTIGYTLNDLDPDNRRKDLLTAHEREHLKKYRTLGRYGMKMVDTVLDLEVEREHQIKTLAVCDGLIETLVIADNDNLPDK